MTGEYGPTVTAPERPSDIWRHDPHALGARGEEVAAASLGARGWTILGRNWQSGYGEVDIIALDPDAEASVVSLIEVKTRLASGVEEPVPELAVDELRRQRYTNAAAAFLRDNSWYRLVRFDVIAITVFDDGMAHLRHVKGAFEVGQ
ncbi:MAG TPA: YraN family protein [Candidatus Olsenella stercoravium]|uniref:UPF0102 protein IAA22_07855 n=1 Tax=Candidatus Olsenella stercoravium TaxID=2838713 RepID=A0A9D2IQG6_9ACTN|nr:YraN family protein [Candidatus Olsenella stercoravium]